MNELGRVGMVTAGFLALALPAFAQEPEGEPPPDEGGYEPIACTSDGDCPPPLACDAELGECTWETTFCESSDECAESFECVPPSRWGECVECTYDENDVETCTSAPCEGPSTCEPMEIACANDGECPAEWSCVVAVDYAIPAYWEAEAGALGCVPDGIVAQGEIIFTTLETGTGDPATDIAATSGPAADGAAGGTPAATGDMMEAMGGDSGPSSGGCSAAPAGDARGAAGSALFALLGLVFLAGRRRLAARRG